MPYCPQCGSPCADDARFCASCGTMLSNTASTAVSVQNTPTYVQPVYTDNVQPVYTTNVNTSSAVKDYRIILIDLGSCKRNTASELLQDLLGYSALEARSILSNLPMEIVHDLTAFQAQYIAQALTEYGIQVSVCNSTGYVDLGINATSSVYNSDGSFVGGLLAVVAALTAINRVRKFERARIDEPYRHLFAPRYHAPKPPKHIRRNPEPKRPSLFSQATIRPRREEEPRGNRPASQGMNHPGSGNAGPGNPAPGRENRPNSGHSGNGGDGRHGGPGGFGRR